MDHSPVTILICTRDRPAQLRRCLEAVQKLKYESYETLVVDNGSREISIPEIAYRKSTRFFSQPVTGISYARNYALPFVKGEILALLDDDAIADPDWLSAGVSRFQDPSTICVTGRILPLELKNEWQKRMLETGWFPAGEKPAVFSHDTFNPYTTLAGTGSNFFIRTSWIRKERFPEVFGPGTPVGAEDEHYLFYRVIRSRGILRYEPAAVVLHEFSANEQEYRRQLHRHGVARGAYLTQMLIAESGMRCKTLSHILRRRASPGKAGFGVSPTLGSLLQGPSAWLRSLLSVGSKRKQSASQGRLVASFGSNAGH